MSVIRLTRQDSPESPPNAHSVEYASSPVYSDLAKMFSN